LTRGCRSRIENRGIEQAAFDDLLDLESSFARLQATNFFGSSKLFEAALDRHEQRKKQKPRSS
jgi:hypothetical protein